MFCFWAGFLAIQTIASEIQRDEAAAAAVVLFRKSKETKDIQKSVEKPDVAGDPEAVVTEKANMDTLTEEQKSKAAGNAIVQPKEVLTWRHVCYDIPVKSAFSGPFHALRLQTYILCLQRGHKKASQQHQWIRCTRQVDSAYGRVRCRKVSSSFFHSHTIWGAILTLCTGLLC